MREQGGGQFSARARRGEQGEDTLLNKDTQDKKASTFVGAKTRRRAALSQVLAAPPSPQQGGGRSARREGRKRRATARHGVKRRDAHTHTATIDKHGRRAFDEGGGCLSRRQIVKTKPESQWIVITRPLYHLQQPVSYSSRLQVIHRPGSGNCDRSRLMQYGCAWLPPGGKKRVFRHGF